MKIPNPDTVRSIEGKACLWGFAGLIGSVAYLFLSAYGFSNFSWPGFTAMIPMILVIFPGFGMLFWTINKIDRVINRCTRYQKRYSAMKYRRETRRDMLNHCIEIDKLDSEEAAKKYRKMFIDMSNYAIQKTIY